MVFGNCSGVSKVVIVFPVLMFHNLPRPLLEVVKTVLESFEIATFVLHPSQSLFLISETVCKESPVSASKTVAKSFYDGITINFPSLLKFRVQALSNGTVKSVSFVFSLTQATFS